MSKAIKILSLSMVALILVMAFNFTMGFIDVTYATTAVGQLKGDSAYYMMETQREVALIVELILKG